MTDRTARPIRVLQSFPAPRPTTNPYIVMLARSLAATPGLAVRTFTWRTALAGRYDSARAEAMLASGLVDVIAFGRPFIANPDLPVRLERGLPLAAFDGSTLFGGSAKGYSDYPAAAAA